MLKFPVIKTTKEQADLLEMKEQDVIMQVEQIANLDDGIIFKYSKALHRDENFTFETIVF